MRQLQYGLLARRAIGAVIAALCMLAWTTDALAGNELYLEVIINDRPVGLIAAFRQKREGGLLIEPGELREVGIVVSPGAGADGAAIDLDRVPGLSYRYNAAAQTISIAVADRLRVPNIYDATQLRAAAVGPADSTPAVPGMVLNYLIHASTEVSAFSDILSDANGGQAIALALDGRVFGPWGVFSQSGIAGASDYETGSIRLDSTWSYSDPQTLITYRAGDIVSGGLAWTRPVRLGGVQVQRSFSLRPDLVTMPMPNFSGTAAVPSTVDIYVNNMRTFSQNVPSGPFEIRNLPVMSGAGTQRIVVTDSLGREVVTNYPFYASTKLLQPGMLDFSAEAGFRRFNFGIESDDYDGDVVGSGSLRYGVQNWMTLESHLEAGAGLLNGGMGAAFPLGRFGVFSAGLGASSYDGSFGMLYATALELALGNATLFARVERTTGGYTDIASLPSEFQRYDYWLTGTLLPPKEVEQLTLAAPLPFASATVTFSYTHLRTAIDDEYEILSAGLNRPIADNMTLSLTAFTDLADSNNSGIFFSLSRAFGNGLSTSASVSTGADGTTAGFDVIKPQPLETNTYGWRVREYEGTTPVRTAAVSYRASAARLEAGVDNVGSAVRARGEVEGAIAVVGNSVFFANRIDDAFAVVDTGMPGVHVFYENRPIGRTNSSGRLIVPSLRSYDRNQITIDPRDLPVDVDVPHTRQFAAPMDRGAALVRFEIEARPSAVVVLHDSTGAALPAGSRGTLEGTGETFVVGYDGRAYLRGLAGENRVSVELEDGSTCHARFPFTPEPGTRVEIKGTVCQ